MQNNKRLGILLIALVFTIWFATWIAMKPETPVSAEFSRPEFEWRSQPAQTFAIPVAGARSITWPNAPKGKARFTFQSSLPVNFGVEQGFGAPPTCTAFMMLSTTIECDIGAGQTEVTIRDSRTQGEVLASAGVGAFTRDRNTLSAITPATVTFSASFFVCVRNCPRL
jgi:hypothetical protein